MLSDNEKWYSEYFQIMCYDLNSPLVNLDNPDSLSLKLSKVFFSDIYLERKKLEDQVKQSIEASELVLSLEGIEGSGKSTIIKKILQDISKENEYFYVILDFNILFPKKQYKWKNATDWSQGIAVELSSEIMSNFFSRGNTEMMEALYEHALFDDTFGHPSDFAEEKASIMENAPEELKNSRESLIQWYKENRLTHPVIVQIKKKLFHNLEFYHYVIALWRDKVIKKKMVIILDNVDRMTHAYQPFCHQFVRDFNSFLSEYVKFIICIRHENAHPPLGTAPYLAPTERIRIADMYRIISSEKNELTSEELHNILSKRQKLYRALYSNSPVVDDLEFLTKALKHTYAEIMLIDLANQSIRKALEYHYYFLRYLLGEYDASTLRQLLSNPRNPRTESFLSSLLYGWVAEYGEVLDNQCLNLPHLLQECETVDYNKHGCDSGYLILAYLLIINQPTIFKDMLDDFLSIGFEEEEMRTQVFKLYSLRDKELGNVLSIWNDDEITSEDKLQGNTVLELNYRGRRLIEHVSCSFMFINKLLYNERLYSKSSKQKLTGSHYDIENYHIHSVENIRFLASLARLHAIELVRISIRMGIGKRWYSEYRSKLCVHGDLQLPRIINSNTAFLEPLAFTLKRDQELEIKTHITILNELRNLYTHEVKRITPETRNIYDYIKITDSMLKGKPVDPAQCFSDITQFV